MSLPIEKTGYGTVQNPKPNEPKPVTLFVWPFISGHQCSQVISVIVCFIRYLYGLFTVHRKIIKSLLFSKIVRISSILYRQAFERSDDRLIRRNTDRAPVPKSTPTTFSALGLHVVKETSRAAPRLFPSQQNSCCLANGSRSTHHRSQHPIYSALQRRQRKALLRPQQPPLAPLPQPWPLSQSIVDRLG